MKGLSKEFNFTGHKPRLSKKKGYALFIVILIIPILYLMASVMLERLTNSFHFSNHQNSMSKAFYIGEAGMSSGFYEFSDTNFTKFTHDLNKTPITNTANRLPITLANVRIDTDGWYVWEWKTSNAYKNFTDAGVYEKYRYRIYPVGISSDRWVIEAEGTYGRDVRRMSLEGATGSTLQFALFANESLSEFVRGQDQILTGKIHSNGDMYFRPSGTTLTMNSDSVTSAGNMYRFKDAWGRADGSGTVRITKGSSSGTLVTMNGASQGASGQGNAFDSLNSQWLDPNNGALNKWSGVVKDASLGARQQEPPPLESLASGGYYNQKAGLVVNSSTVQTGITNKTFYNKAEGRSETVKEINLQTLNYPSNGLLYATTPVRLVNGAKLKASLTVVSNSTVYTVGDINKTYGDQTAYNNRATTKKPAAIVTSGRIYHLSGGWKDSSNGSSGSAMQTAKDDPLYSGDDANVVEINAALVDGPPQVDEINYVSAWKGVTNPRYNPVDQPGGAYCWANSDDLLEDWGVATRYSGKDVTPVLRKKGSIIHLENANMAKLDNSDAGPGVTAWVVKSSYSPPVRDYSYDGDFKNPALQPPYFPSAAQRIIWRDLGSEIKPKT
jgi:Tfp pilus assembly protein PilX